MKTHHLSNQALHDQLTRLATEERRITLEVLHHLRESERRRLFAERGHSSLFDYVVRELGYSESSAQRRISAMRALRDLPELEPKIETGELKVTQLARVQTFLRAEKKEGKNYTQEERRELILETVGKSSRETEKLLAEKSPAFAHQERIKILTPELTQISITADEELIKNLARIRDLYAHQLPSGATTADLIAFMAKRLLTQHEKKVQVPTSKTPAPKGKSLPLPQVSTRYIPSPVRRAVWNRDRGRCVYISTTTGRVCGSQHRLQIDHIRPFSLGGSSSAGNLRLLCFHHNQAEANRVFGNRKP